MNVRYRVELSHAERRELAALLSEGKQAVRKLKRAQILLAADPEASGRANSYRSSPTIRVPAFGPREVRRPS